MKIGAIRRIDELGRIVIPKSIRKDLRIKDGDNLEIYVETDNIVIKKHSEFNKLLDVVSSISKTLKESLKCSVVITDKDKILVKDKDIKNEEISSELLAILNERNNVIKESIKLNKYEIVNGSIYIKPVIVNGDLVGSVIIIKDTKVTESDVNQVDLMTSFLIKYVE